MTGVLPMFPERRKRQHAFVLEPILGEGQDGFKVRKGSMN